MILTDHIVSSIIKIIVLDYNELYKHISFCKLKKERQKKQLFINITAKLLRQMQFPYAKTKGGNTNYNYLNKTYQNS